MKKLVKFLKDYANGEDAEAEFDFTWFEGIAIIVVIGLIAFLIWK